MTVTLFIELLLKSGLIAGVGLLISAALRGRPATEAVDVLRATVLLLLALPVLMLVLPTEVSQGPDRLSILSPAGAALLGLSVGASIDWPSKGRTLRLTLISVA